jgi:hypothetical protein
MSFLEVFLLIFYIHFPLPLRAVCLYAEDGMNVRVIFATQKGLKKTNIEGVDIVEK